MFCFLKNGISGKIHLLKNGISGNFCPSKNGISGFLVLQYVTKKYASSG